MASPNRQYESMLTVARERLSRHAPESIARRAGVTWDGGRLTLPSLGQTVTVTVPDFAVSPELDMWHALTLLHYLDLADGTPLLGKMMAFAQYPDGMVRGGGFDRRAGAAQGALSVGRPPLYSRLLYRYWHGNGGEGLAVCGGRGRGIGPGRFSLLWGARAKGELCCARLPKIGYLRF